MNKDFSGNSLDFNTDDFINNHLNDFSNSLSKNVASSATHSDTDFSITSFAAVSSFPAYLIGPAVNESNPHAVSSVPLYFVKPGQSNPATIPDRVISDFGQGGIGDCWYLASIKALSILTLGKSILSNIIKIDSGTITVLFPGAPTFVFKTSQIALTTEINDGDNTDPIKGHSAGPLYTPGGDADVVLLEMAVKSYVDNVSSSVSHFISSPYTGGYMYQALELLTGKLSISSSSSSAELDNLAKVIDHTAITAACENGYDPSLDIPADHHAYSVIGIDSVNKTVSFRNPWYSGTVLKTISYANFLKYFQEIDYLDLNTTNKYTFGSSTSGTPNGTKVKEQIGSSDGKFLSNNEVNNIIHQMSSSASHEGIAFNKTDDTVNNQNLMNIVPNSGMTY